MNDLVIATFLNEIKRVWKDSVSDPDLIVLMYNAVSEPAGLKGQTGQHIDVKKGTASKIMKRMPGGNFHREIKKHIADPAVNESIVPYFEKNVVKRLQPLLVDDLIHRLRICIFRDLNIVQSTKDRLLELGDKKTLAQFLASVYQYCVPLDNVLKPGKVEQNEEIHDYNKNHPLPQIQYGEKIGVDEKKYVDALLAVYAEELNKPELSFDELCENSDLYEHFKRNRNDYFAAEAVRRGTRDIYTEVETDQFEVFINETYYGVIDVWEDDFSSGMKRLRGVLAQAAGLPMDSCWLSRDTVWIGAAQKKGACHMLVNESRLKGWIKP